MSRLHLKENSSYAMERKTQSLPLAKLGRKRRSSILKPQRPFTEVQNLSRGRDDSRMTKDRRVSFCPTIEVKEFHKHPADLASRESEPASRSNSEDDGGVKQVCLSTAEDPPQMSTPIKKKKRRISATSQPGRLSIIPKFERSFIFPDDDFQIFEDSDLQTSLPPPATAPCEEITLLEDLPEPDCQAEQRDVMLDLNLNEAPEASPLSQAPPTSLSPSLSSELPADDAQRLAELFPGATVPPLASAPTIIGTPTIHSNTHYLAMATPDMITPERPAKRRRISMAELMNESSLELTGTESPLSQGLASSELRSMSLTCVDSHLPSINHTPCEATPSPTHVTSATVTDTVAMTLTCNEDESEAGSCAGHVTSAESVPPSQPLDGEGEGLTMDLTCLSDSTFQSSISQHSSSPADQDNNPPANQDATQAEVQDSEPAKGSRPPAASEETVSGETHTSPVFKAPKRPLRSQLKLKSSGRKIVIASPAVRTPQLHASSLSASLSQTAPLNTTFTVAAPPPQNLPLPPTPASVRAAASSISHLSTGEGVACSLTASPPVSGSPAPTEAGSAWLQSPGESFNLIHSGDETLTSTQELSPPQPQLLRDSQGNVSFVPEAIPVVRSNPPKQVDVHQTTPTVDHAPSHTTRLEEALQRLKVTGPQVTIPPSHSIETPEAVLVMNGAPPTAPSSHLLVPRLPAELNDTTICGGRTPPLSTSIYDKFMRQICRETLLPSAQSVLTTEREATPKECGGPETFDKTAVRSQPTSSQSSQPVSSSLFSCFLSDLTSRLQEMLCSCLQRLNSEEYCSTHQCLPVVLDKWSRVFAACLGTLTVLEQYGELSGQSHTHYWDDKDLPSEIPLPPLGQEDMQQAEISMKLEWLMELSGFYSTLTPLAELARDEAAELYGWHFEEWSQDTHRQNVKVVLNSTPYNFQVSPSEIAADRVGATSSVAQAVWDHIQQ